MCEYSRCKPTKSISKPTNMSSGAISDDNRCYSSSLCLIEIFLLLAANLKYSVSRSAK